MGRYAKLATLAVRWTALCFFLLALFFLPLGFAGGMGAMMAGYAGPTGSATSGYGVVPFWWGPSLANLMMGALLFALSGKIGGALAVGLED
jgi:hypothetical protein